MERAIMRGENQLIRKYHVSKQITALSAFAREESYWNSTSSGGMQEEREGLQL